MCQRAHPTVSSSVATKAECRTNLQTGKDESSPADLFSISEGNDVVGKKNERRHLREFARSSDASQRGAFSAHKNCGNTRQREQCVRPDEGDGHPYEPLAEEGHAPQEITESCPPASSHDTRKAAAIGPEAPSVW